MPGALAALVERAAHAPDERSLSELRRHADEEIEHAVRSADFRERALGYRAVGSMRYRAKMELLRRGLDDDSPACRGAALLSLELLSRDHAGDVNAVRSMLHSLANADPNATVRRLATICLRNGSAHKDTIVLLEHIGANDEEDRELRAAATKVAAALKKKARA
jgi:hypothetical protein